MSNRFKDYFPTRGLFRGCTFSLDVTECRMARPNDKDMEVFLWSGKAFMPSLKYEGMNFWLTKSKLLLIFVLILMSLVISFVVLVVATQISTGRVVWINGGVPAISDLEIAKRFNIFAQMMPNERCLVDKGYVDVEYEHSLIFPYKGTLSRDQELFNRAIAAIRITVERSNRLFKNFRILKDAFRGHSMEEHHIIVETIGKLINVRIDELPLVRNIHPLLYGKRTTYKLKHRNRL